MGTLENNLRHKIRKTKINQAIITVLAVAVVGALNPTMLVRGVLKELGKGKNKRRSAQNSIYEARKRLVHKGLLEYENGLLKLTDSGRAWLQLVSTNDFKLRKPKLWDKKWRILIFDIREERKGLREKIRRTLVSIGFARLQDSVWVYPYNCEDLISLLKADFRVGKDLLYIIADEIENDVLLRKKFGLD